MAATRTDFTLTAGFTADNLLDKLGEVFFSAGLMTSATAWHDSFVDTNGTRVRIMAEVVASGARGTVYHAFFCPNNSSFSTDRHLHYTYYASWDTTLHQATGTTNFDNQQGYKNPDAVPTGYWVRYFNKIAEMSNSADATYSLFTSTGVKSALLHITAPGEARNLGFALPGATLNSNCTDFTNFCPPGMYAVAVNPGGNVKPEAYIFPLSMLKSDYIFGAGTDAASTYKWSTNASKLGYVSGNGQNELGHFRQELSNIHPPYPKVGSTNVPADGYYGVNNIRLFNGFYTDVTSGDVGFIYGINTGFDPAVGDTLVVSAGVEEYLVISVNITSGSAGRYNDWNCAVVRMV